MFHQRTEHMEVDCHSIREAFDLDISTLPRIPSNLRIFYIVTKA